MTKNKSPMITITLPAEKFLVVTADHGGYKGGYCFACGASGWIGSIVHTSECPVGLVLSPPTPEPKTPEEFTALLADYASVLERRNRMHTLSLGKAMSGQVYADFTKLRDEEEPRLRKQILALMSRGEKPKASPPLPDIGPHMKKIVRMTSSDNTDQVTLVLSCGHKHFVKHADAEGLVVGAQALCPTCKDRR